jgi:hypothetical protein
VKICAIKNASVIKQTVVKATARIDWRKLLVPSLLILVLPTVSAFVLDRWLGTLPLITIVVILICFPTAVYVVIRVALREMDRVIAEITPSLPESETLAQRDGGDEPSSTP